MSLEGRRVTTHVARLGRHSRCSSGSRSHGGHSGFSPPPVRPRRGAAVGGGFRQLGPLAQPDGCGRGRSASQHALGAQLLAYSRFSVADARAQARSLSTMLLARSHRQVDTERVAAFAKRLSAVAFHAETGEAMGSLAVVSELLNRHQKLRRLLVRWNESLSSSCLPSSEPPAPCSRAGEREWSGPFVHAGHHGAGERVRAFIVPLGGVAPSAPCAPLSCCTCDARGVPPC